MYVDILLGRDEKETFYASILDQDLRKTYLAALNRVSRWWRWALGICALFAPLYVVVRPNRDPMRLIVPLIICLIEFVNIAAKIRLIRMVNLLQTSAKGQK